MLIYQINNNNNIVPIRIFSIFKKINKKINMRDYLGYYIITFMIELWIIFLIENLSRYRMIMKVYKITYFKYFNLFMIHILRECYIMIK